MIYRAEHKTEYTVIDNGLIEDRRLSSDAFRLLVFMLARSDNFDFSVGGLAYLIGWPPRKVARLITELKRSGYIEQIARTDEKGRFIPSEWVVREEPVTAIRENRRADKPHNGRTAQRTDRTADRPHCGRGVVLPNKDIYQIKINTKEGIKPNKEGAKIFKKPTVDEVAQYCQERKNSVNPQHFIDHYEANGWKVGKNPMKDWRAAVRTWERNDYDRPRAVTKPIEDDENVFDKIIRERGLT